MTGQISKLVSKSSRRDPKRRTRSRSRRSHQIIETRRNKESDFFTQPVELQTNALYPIANNGSASTPFYTALCLWVGAVLLSSVATTEYYLGKKDRNNFTKREQFVARMLTFLTMAIAQSLIVTLGNIFLLGVDVQNPVQRVICCLDRLSVHDDRLCLGCIIR